VNESMSQWVNFEVGSVKCEVGSKYKQPHTA
jgi:hypothetical protein